MGCFTESTGLDICPSAPSAGVWRISTQRDSKSCHACPLGTSMCLWQMAPTKHNSWGKKPAPELEAESHKCTIVLHSYICLHHSSIFICHPHLNSGHAKGWTNISVRDHHRESSTCTVLIKIWNLTTCLQIGCKNQNSLMHVQHCSSLSDSLGNMKLK